MSHYTPSALPNTRIDAADLLRGIAVAGIISLHFIEHLNFYNFPPPTKLDTAVWNVAFFVLSNKMYAIFAMLFGLTLFVQHDNQARRGRDFRPRFAWRMVLLFCFGLVNLMFFNGDILTVYAVCGLLVLPFVRAGNRVLLAAAVFFGLQPIELFYFIGSLLDPSLQPLNLGSDNLFVAILPAQEGGSWLDVAVAGLRYGLPVNFTWAIEHGRFTQTLFLFLLGLWIGRRRLLYDEGRNAVMWRRAMGWSVVAFTVLGPLRYPVPQMVGQGCASASLTVMLDMWKNLSMTIFYVSAITLAYHRTRARRLLSKVLPYGKTSLTNYIGQSVAGMFIFYGIGAGLGAGVGLAATELVALGVFALQALFSMAWLRYCQFGPLEWVWRMLNYGKRLRLLKP